MTTNPTLEEILLDTKKYAPAFPKEGTNVREIVAHLKAETIARAIKEIIGEDEPRNTSDLEERVYMIPARNELKAQQRQRLNKFLGRTE